MLDLSSHWFIVSTLSSSPTFDPMVGNVLVNVKRINQYTTRTGQNTGTSKIENQVQRNPMEMALVAEYQNLNSGRRLMNGLNSSSCFVGSPPAAPSSISLSIASFEGSNFGWRKARKRLSR